MARILAPWAASKAAAWLPIKPAAPVTRTVLPFQKAPLSEVGNGGAVAPEVRSVEDGKIEIY
jgi:hypothetical protein